MRTNPRKATSRGAGLNPKTNSEYCQKYFTDFSATLVIQGRQKYQV